MKLQRKKKQYVTDKNNNLTSVVGICAYKILYMKDLGNNQNM